MGMTQSRVWMVKGKELVIKDKGRVSKGSFG